MQIKNAIRKTRRHYFKCVKNIEERTFIINFMKKYAGMYVN